MWNEIKEKPQMFGDSKFCDARQNTQSCVLTLPQFEATQKNYFKVKVLITNQWMTSSANFSFFSFAHTHLVILFDFIFFSK